MITDCLIILGIGLVSWTIIGVMLATGTNFGIGKPTWKQFGKDTLCLPMQVILVCILGGILLLSFLLEKIFPPKVGNSWGNIV